MQSEKLYQNHQFNDLNLLKCWYLPFVHLFAHCFHSISSVNKVSISDKNQLEEREKNSMTWQYSLMLMFYFLFPHPLETYFFRLLPLFMCQRLRVSGKKIQWCNNRFKKKNWLCKFCVHFIRFLAWFPHWNELNWETVEKSWFALRFDHFINWSDLLFANFNVIWLY